MTAPAQSTSVTVREARARYFAENGFDERGYADRWVRLQAGPVPIYFPNTAARVRSIRVHDVHHVVTGYATTWTGEAEIGAWEIASGCADHAAAWVLNLMAMPIGLAIAPAATFRAFGRGRHSANLYRRVIDDALLDRPVAALAHELHLNESAGRTTPGDVAAFVSWSIAAVATLLAVIGVTFSPIIAAVALLV